MLLCKIPQHICINSRFYIVIWIPITDTSMVKLRETSYSECCRLYLKFEPQKSIITELTYKIMFWLHQKSMTTFREQYSSDKFKQTCYICLPDLHIVYCFYSTCFKNCLVWRRLPVSGITKMLFYILIQEYLTSVVQSHI